tara:strand:+ start:183 stop:680 length:498 start_codon:yes stop_codon:yes gene_type:complete
MTKKRTAKSRYKRITCEGYCTFEDYLAEWLIIRWTDEFKMDKPPNQFWNIPGKYQEMYHRNMKAAKSLVKKYEPSLIFAAIKSKYFKNIYHIGLKCYGPRGWKYNPLAVEAIKRYDKEHKHIMKLAEAKADQEETQVEQVEQKKLKARTKQYSSKKTSINKLRDL